MLLKEKDIQLAALFMFKDGDNTTIQENKAIVKVVEKLMFNKDEKHYIEDYDGITAELYLRKLLKKQV